VSKRWRRRRAEACRGRAGRLRRDRQRSALCRTFAVDFEDYCHYLETGKGPDPSLRGLSSPDAVLVLPVNDALGFRVQRMTPVLPAADAVGLRTEPTISQAELERLRVSAWSEAHAIRDYVYDALAGNAGALQRVARAVSGSEQLRAIAAGAPLRGRLEAERNGRK
jgi:hypothetical protein